MIEFIKKSIRSRKFYGFVICCVLAFLKILTFEFVSAYTVYCGANEYAKRFRNKDNQAAGD